MMSISSGWKVLALPVLLLCELIRNCKMLTITVQLQPQQFDFPLKTRVANYLLTRLHIYQPTWNPRVIPNRMPAVRSTKGRHSTMRASLSSAGVSWRTLMGYPSYARNCACALPSPSPYHYVMAKIVLRENLLTFPCVVIRNIFIRKLSHLTIFNLFDLIQVLSS